MEFHLTPDGLQLLLDYEVGGGKAYYDRVCSHPTVPGDKKDTSSGVTIGVGYDLGQQTSTSRFIDEWEEFLGIDELASLAWAIGLQGYDARQLLPHVKQIEIPWEKALEQFLRFTAPRYWDMTERGFPGIGSAPQCVKEALLSLVFNRGTAMPGDRRREMRTIRDLVEDGRWSDIPSQFRKMVRLWPDSKGLRDRREREARFIEKGLAQA